MTIVRQIANRRDAIPGQLAKRAREAVRTLAPPDPARFDGETDRAGVLLVDALLKALHGGGELKPVLGCIRDYLRAGTHEDTAIAAEALHDAAAALARKAADDAENPPRVGPDRRESDE
jgi:hypothetical protein